MQLASPDEYDAYVSAQVKHEMKLQRVRNELQLVMEFMVAFEKLKPLDEPRKLEFERIVTSIQRRTFHDDVAQTDDTVDQSNETIDWGE